MAHYSQTFYLQSPGSCKLLQFLTHLAFSANIFCVVAIAIDRYKSIVHPFSPKMTNMKCAISISVVWTTAALYEVKSALVHEVSLERHLDDGEWMLYVVCVVSPSLRSSYRYFYLVIFDFICIYLIPLFLVVILYHRVYCNMNKDNSSVASERLVLKRKRKVVRMLISIVIVIATCQLPYHIWKLVYYINGVFSGYLIWRQICDIIAFSNSWINVVVYVYFNDNFRLAVNEFLRKVLSSWTLPGQHRANVCCLAMNRIRPSDQGESTIFVTKRSGVGTVTSSRIGV